MRWGGIFLTAEDRLKLGVIGGLAVIDAGWLRAAGYKFDVASLSSRVLLVGALLFGAEIYRRADRNPHFATITRETAWLIAFSLAAGLLSNLAITANLPLVDNQLAAFDHALGFHWRWWYEFISSDKPVGTLLSAAYVAALPEIVIVMVALAALNRADRVSEMVLATMIGALIAIAISTLIPAAGPLPYFHPDEATLAVPPVVDLDYKSTFFALRLGMVHAFSVDDLKGLIAFPSYHATLAVLLVLATRGIPRLFWPAAVINAVVLASAPVDGGHHLADVVGGMAVAVVSLAIAHALRGWVMTPHRIVLADAAATATPGRMVAPEKS